MLGGGGRRRGRGSWSWRGEEEAGMAWEGEGHEEGELELEEGEAVGAGAYGRDDFVDPDALTYIDEKLQSVLGHFQKDFEGGVLAENLGSQYGGYGSFLPTYERSPSVLSQSRSPAVPPNRGSASRSPYIPVEHAQKNNFFKTAVDIRRKNDYSQRTPNGISGNPPQDALNRVVNGCEPKAQKIRIKVSSNKNLARNTAAMYSGLGLDISPASSMDGSLDESAGAHELTHLPDESPNTIFQIMTWCPASGGMLSPLAENVLELRRKLTPVTKKPEAPALDGNKESYRDWCRMISAAEDKGIQMEEKTKYDKKKDHHPGSKSSKLKYEKAAVVNKRIKPELRHVSDDIDSIFVSRSIKTEHHSVEESAKLVAEVSDHLKETENGPLKVQIDDRSSMGDMESVVDVKANKLVDADEHPEGKAKANTVRKAFEGWSKDSKIEPSLDHGYLGKIKYDSDEYNDETVTTSNQLQNVSPYKTSLERDKGKVVHAKGEPSQYKRKEIGNVVNSESMDIITGNVGKKSSGIPNGKKKTPSLQPAMPGKKLKGKPHKQLNNGNTGKSYDEGKSMKPKKETLKFGVTDNDILVSGNGDDCKISPIFVDKSAPMLSACKNESIESSMAVPAPASILINEEWVCCDKCEKWRLLPYGMNPDHLPKKWRCSMQSWLPGMNNCKLSEDETTKALRALYMVPVPENNVNLDDRHDISTLGIGMVTNPPTFEGNLKATAPGKLKVQSNDADNLSNNLNLSAMSKQSKKPHAPKSRKPDGVDCFPKLKEKRKHMGSSDKGDIVAKDQAHPKSKSSVGVNHDDLRASKKMKKDFNEPTKHHPSDIEISKFSPSNKESLKSSPKFNSISPVMGKHGLSSSVKCFHDENKIYSDRDIRTSDGGWSDLPDPSFKRKKSKQRQVSQHSPNPLSSNFSAKYVVKEALSDHNAAKENSRSELKILNTADHGKVAHARGLNSGIDGNEIGTDKEHLSDPHQQGVHSQHSLLSKSSMRRDICYAQASVTATSSSSKVSSSYKSKADFQETRSSPVESVSSSPLRSSDKNLLDQHRSYSCAVAENVHFQKSGKSGSSCSKEKYGFGSGSGHAKAPVSGLLNADIHGALQKDKQSLLGNDFLKNEDSGLGKRSAQLNPVTGENVESHALSVHHYSDHKQPPSHLNGKTAPHFNPSQSDTAKLTSGKHPMQVKPNKVDVEYKDLKLNPCTVKGSKRHPLSNNTSEDAASHKAKQSKKGVVENMKQVTPNTDASSLINASVLLKEARDLKHLSKRLKEKGDDIESASMCFEAVLKFLHAASLWEAPNIDSSKQVDSVQTMKLYSETGNLCVFCAREFERLKKMANAALAYKCVEVAYMKASFYKHPGATKDRHALQAASLMAPPAESPSSSASDVDNLNNQNTAAKVISARSVCSPQIASNIISRNNHHLASLLAYVEDINYAFDGTRKSQSSFSAYLAGIGKDQVDAVALVREVLDFSFHNVEGLLQLIRQSLETISHEK